MEKQAVIDPEITPVIEQTAGEKTADDHVCPVPGKQDVETLDNDLKKRLAEIPAKRPHR